MFHALAYLIRFQIEGQLICQFRYLRPSQPLSEFSQITFLPCPDKDPLDKSSDAPFLSIQCAKARIIQGKKNAGDTFVPGLTISKVKSKWAVLPVNTKSDRSL